MFPRLSHMHRFVAIFCVIVVATLMLFNAQTTLGKNRRFLRLNSIMVEKLQDGYSANLFQSVLPIRMFELTTEVPMTTTPPIVNPHNFSYIINPKHICSDKSLKMITYVHTAPVNYKKRQMIRQTWGTREILTKYKGTLVFVMGQVEDKKVMDAVKLESNRYGDIVQEDFNDSYKNLTYKAITALRWISTNCKQVSLVLKTDDDILVDIHSLMDYMNSTVIMKHGMKKLIVCNQWLSMKVIRDKKSKWYVQKSEFEDEFFPPYCSGSAFVMSFDVVQDMYQVSFYTPFFWVDDFYITGLLVKKLNITHMRLNDGYILNAQVAMEKLQQDKKQELKFFHVHKLTNIYKMWTSLNLRRNVSNVGVIWHPTTVAGNSSVKKR
ncbi:hypothetical protein CHS0354_026615 [Potamilus streckersoni]|uniref:Hexosyltransferase n=1 Tax=Potamilus streckersoni TaxID=2493646 RepID=A0AAE0SIB9_9BIVA|nr:hypothetical protein CHS0354_026615 [Potamilus streckersoni]